MAKTFKIGDRVIGEGQPCYIIAEVSCNHEGNIEEAKKIIAASAAAGVDAVKIQTYTADTMTRKFDTKPEGTIWENMDLHALYEKAHTPWEWAVELKDYAISKGLQFFSTPFDETSVDFLVDEVGVDVLKVASFEVVDIPLLKKMARTGLPIIMSNGMTDFLEMQEAVNVLRENGCKDLALLHCNSGYPAAFEEANLKTMQAMEGIFGTMVGVSDHTLFANADAYETPLAHVTALEAVKMGAKIVEVHVMSDRDYARTLFDKGEGGFDWPFSRNPDEMKKTVDLIRAYERGESIGYETEVEKEAAAKTHGSVNFTPTAKEMNSRGIRPSLWVVGDLKAGETLQFAAENKAGNFDSIRPAGGIHTRFATVIEGAKVTRDIKAGEPLQWDMIALAS